MKVALTIVFVWVCGVAWAAVINTDGSLVDAQAKYNGSASGDTLKWPPAGSFTYSGAFFYNPNKTTVLDGNGSSVVHGGGYTGPLIQPSSGTASISNLIHVTNFKFTDSAVLPDLQFDGGFSNAWFWVDQCTLTRPSNPEIFAYIYQAWGLINSNYFAAPSNSEMLHNQAWNPSLATNGWTSPILSNSIQAVYIENNLFTNNGQVAVGNPAYFFGNSAVQCYYGAHTVFRTNTLWGSQFDNHGGGTGLLGGVYWEVYENDFWNVANANQSQYLSVRSGTGMAFNNRAHNANLGAGQAAFALQAGDWNFDVPGIGLNFALAPFNYFGTNPNVSFATDQPGNHYNLVSTNNYLWSGVHPFLVAQIRNSTVTITGKVTVTGNGTIR